METNHKVKQDSSKTTAE